MIQKMKAKCSNCQKYSEELESMVEGSLEPIFILCPKCMKQQRDFSQWCDGLGDKNTMGTIQSQTTFDIDFYLTDKQYKVLEKASKYTKMTPQGFIAYAFGSWLESIFEEEGQFTLPYHAWKDKPDKRQVKKTGRTKVSIHLKLPAHRVKLLYMIQPIADAFWPTYFQFWMEDSTRAHLESLTDYECPRDMADRLCEEWKKAEP